MPDSDFPRPPLALRQWPAWLAIAFGWTLARWPWWLVRRTGPVLGTLLRWLMIRRRAIAARNLALCFPHEPLAVRRRWARECVVYFAQAWFDRGWLWNGPSKEA